MLFKLDKDSPKKWKLELYTLYKLPIFSPKIYNLIDMKKKSVKRGYCRYCHKYCVRISTFEANTKKELKTLIERWIKDGVYHQKCYDESEFNELVLP